MKFVFEDTVEFHSEDGGCALVSENIQDPHTDPNNGLFVRIQSWDERRDHPYRHVLARLLDGKRVRVTVELVEGPTVNLSPVSLRRLKDGLRGLAQPILDEKATTEQLQMQLGIIEEGLVALQSLDDLGAELNERAARYMDELFRRRDIVRGLLAMKIGPQ